MSPLLSGRSLHVSFCVPDIGPSPHPFRPRDGDCSTTTNRVITLSLRLLDSPLHLCQEALYKYTCTCLVASVMSDCVTLWTVAHQAPQSTGFSRQEYWSGLTCPPSGDLPDPGIESLSHTLLHWQAGSFYH
ncbi:unnamed protein product [Rangifer tarandus platyrhynchus]|uniref:Uncharacterized protein n=2 Tax=Rangifer tarandus platyrhynchus TaxID=3082113 RepID=A0ABN8ZXX4_RANTA|nr:unnamed protein product [Rangifer tarandus platyrhynchus]